MFRGISSRQWRPPVGDPRLDAALGRGTLVCLSVEALADEGVETIVLPWPQVVDGNLVFHDPGPTRRLALPASAFADTPAVGGLYAAQLADGEPDAAASPLAWPAVDVTAQVRAFRA